MTYRSDSQPHCKVAQDYNSQRNETASNHEDNHVGLNSRVLASTEYIGSTGCLQSMRPVPDGGGGSVYVSTCKFKTTVNTELPAPSKDGRGTPNCRPYPREHYSSCGPFGIELDVSKRFAYNYPSLPGDDGQ